MKILISGSSGLIGSAFLASLNPHENQVYKLIRERERKSSSDIPWNPEEKVSDVSLLEGFDAVVHLAGENIMGRWTDLKKKKIKESRVLGTNVLCQTLSKLKKPPSVLICASGIAYYGEQGDEVLTEHRLGGEGFLAKVCEEWEEAARPAVEKGIRVVHLRIGMVLSSKGGAFAKLIPIFRLGLGGQLGPGNQYMSWISIEDLVRIIVYSMQHESLAGPINAVSPFPVTNKEFAKTLGKVLHRPAFLTVPTFAINLVFGEMGNEVLLSSIRVKPEKLELSGFTFKYPNLEDALTNLCGNG